MTCEEFQARVAELALESLEPGAARELAAHLAEPVAHSGCAAILTALRDAAQAPGLALDPVPAPPALWRSIEAQIAPPQPKRMPAAAWALIAASLLAAAGALALWRTAAQQASEAALQAAAAREDLRADRAKRIDAEQGILTAKIACAKNVEELKHNLSLSSEAVALLEQPGTQVLTFAPQPTHPDLKAAAIYNAKTGRAFVVSTALPPVSGRDYQLWVIRGKATPVPAGMLAAVAPGAMQGEIDPHVLEGHAPDALAISIEPTGGSKSPTDVAMVAPLRS